MKKVYFSFLICFALSLNLCLAQEKADSLKDWKIGGSLSINFNNTGLVNWAGGGQNAIALGSIIDLFANYKKGKDSWDNSLNWSSGLARTGDNTNLIRKSDDQLIIFSKYRRNIKERWGFAAFAELRTQVFDNPEFETFGVAADGSDSLVDGKRERNLGTITSALLSPGYLTTSIGWEYNKGKDFYLHISPLAGRSTFVIDDSLSAEGAYGVDPGSTIRFQLGTIIRSGFKTKLMENVDFASNITLFSPYESFIETVDVTWETLTSFKINKYLSTTFSTQLLYFDAANNVTREDGSTFSAVQFKHVLNVGFLAKF